MNVMRMSRVNALNQIPLERDEGSETAEGLKPPHNQRFIWVTDMFIVSSIQPCLIYSYVLLLIRFQTTRP